MTFIFNSKKETTDNMENAICCQFFLIAEEKTYNHRGTIATNLGNRTILGQKSHKKNHWSFYNFFYDY